jgi:hypothetical protein
MKVQLVSFGQIEVEGKRYDHDVVIEQGRVRKRDKKASKAHRKDNGHTPLSAEEHIPWHGKQLFIGTGAYGSLPVMASIYSEAATKGVDVVTLPTEKVCELVKELRKKDVNAILHVTC